MFTSKYMYTKKNKRCNNIIILYSCVKHSDQCGGFTCFLEFKNDQ